MTSPNTKFFNKMLLEMNFTTQLLKGLLLSDIVKVINRYIIPKNVTLEQMYKLGLIEPLMSFCQNTNINYDNGLSIVCQYNYLEIVNLMIKKGAKDWNEGLYSACKTGNIEFIELMVEKGANDWNSGLGIACQGGHLEIVNLMIKKEQMIGIWDFIIHVKVDI
jgi:hypothetical protein